MLRWAEVACARCKSCLRLRSTCRQGHKTGRRQGGAWRALGFGEAGGEDEKASLDEGRAEPGAWAELQ